MAIAFTMAPTTSTYGLTLTRGQADYLLRRLVTIAELARKA